MSKQSSHTTTINLQFLYQAAYLEDLGVTPAEFAADPKVALDRVGQYDAIDLVLAGMRPLLPAQVKVRQELESSWEASGVRSARRSATRINTVHRPTPTPMVLAA